MEAMGSQEPTRAGRYLEEILGILIKHNPLQIVLFGSVNTGEFKKDSDIDLLVILDINTIPGTYEEKMKMKLELRRSLRSINRKIPIDLLVFTSKEIEIMSNQKNPFIEEIMNKGKILYEKAS